MLKSISVNSDNWKSLKSASLFIYLFIYLFIHSFMDVFIYYLFGYYFFGQWQKPYISDGDVNMKRSAHFWPPYIFPRNVPTVDFCYTLESFWKFLCLFLEFTLNNASCSSLALSLNLRFNPASDVCWTFFFILLTLAMDVMFVIYINRRIVRDEDDDVWFFLFI